jgi:AcrR family transcriptional regulator
MIQSEALRLFSEQGYAQTTVEQIADAAAISPRTFFRYFPSKEDVVLWDEYDDPAASDLVAARTVGEPLAETIRVLIRETLSGLYRSDPERLLARVRLAVTVPELRARFLREEPHGFEELAQLLTEKRGSAVDVQQLRVLTSAFLATAWVALDLWQRSDGEDDLLELIDRAIDSLVAGTAALR